MLAPSPRFLLDKAVALVEMINQDCSVGHGRYPMFGACGRPRRFRGTRLVMMIGADGGGVAAPLGAGAELGYSR